LLKETEEELVRSVQAVNIAAFERLVRLLEGDVAGQVLVDTSGGRIEVEITTTTGCINGNIELDTAGGDITLRVPSILRVLVTS